MGDRNWYSQKTKEQCQQFLDWMALHGYNLPLTFTGQELVWRKLWMEYNVTSAQVETWLAGNERQCLCAVSIIFFCFVRSGPAFQAWQRMGNLRGWGGPMTMNWMTKQAALGKRIATRQQELGMINVLPGFAGHVPEALKIVFPNANITQSPNWWGAPPQYCCDYLLEPRDPLFQTIGKRFYQLITQGTHTELR